MHRIGKLQTSDPLGPVCNERFAAQDRACKSVQYADMLRIFAVQFDCDLMSGGLFEAACCRKAEVTFALFELEERQFVMLCYEFAAFQSNFKAVRAGSVCCGRDKNAGCAIRKFEISGYVVLDLDLVPFAVVAEGTDAAGESTDPLQEV